NLGQVGSAVQRDAHRTTLVRERGKDRLSDPPDGVGDELDPLLRVELPRSRHQPDVPLLDQVGQANAAVLILLRYRYDKAEVGAYELRHSVFVPLLGSPAEFDLL